MPRSPQNKPLLHGQERATEVEPQQLVGPVRKVVVGVTVGAFLSLASCTNPSVQKDSNEDTAVRSSDSGVVIKTDTSKRPSSTPLPTVDPLPANKPLGPEDVGYQDPKLFEALKQTFEQDFPSVELVNGPVRLKSEVGLPLRGIPGWPKRYTPGWDFEKVGNIDRTIQLGIYRIEASDIIKTDREKVPMLKGYSRNGIGRIPPLATRKIVRMSNSLMIDLNMPVFTGIFIKIDGFDVMIIKEIHMHEFTEAARAQLSAMRTEISAEENPNKRKMLLKRKKAFSNQHQPHTGISFALKK